MNHVNSHSSLNSLNEWLFYLESIHATEIDMGLERISLVAKRLNISLANSKVITVAGTNGKGTSCAFIENALLANGHTVAVYSSPHIEIFNERLRINKELIDDKSLISAFALIEQTRGEISLTYYEYTTLAALMICQQTSPDVVILEVGLGGRLDATNFIDCDIAVITTIDLDHQNFLGNDRVSIGLEKAGIVRAGKPVIIGDPNFPEQVLQFCLAAKSKPVQRNVDFFIDTSERSKAPQKNQPLGQQVTWQWRTDNLTLGPLPKTHIPQDNVALGLAVLQQLNVELTLANVSDYIAATKVPGRTEVINEQPLVVLDVGHNPHAARYLAKFVTQQNKAKIYAVTAMLADKDINSTLAELIESVDYWYTGSLDISRAASADLMSKTLKDLGKHCNSFDNIIDAYRMALDNANNNDMILVFGSFFTVAKIKQSLF